MIIKKLTNTSFMSWEATETLDCKEYLDGYNVHFTELDVEEINEAYFTLVEELVAPALADVLREPNDDSTEETLANRFRRVNANLGHPSNVLFAWILKEAGAPETVINEAKNIECETCEA